MHKYGESKTTRIMVATVRHVTYGSGLDFFFFLTDCTNIVSFHLLAATVAFAIVNDSITGTTYIQYTSSDLLRIIYHEFISIIADLLA
jgi:hypothetical protein